MDRAAWRLLGAALAAPLDSLFGEAAPRIHPVRLFGGLMEQLEELVWHDGVAAGAAYAAMGVGLGVLVGRVLACLRPGNGRSSLGRLTKRRLQGRELIASAAAAYISVGARALFDSARDVSVALEAGDVDSARLLVSSLVGRDTDGLGVSEIARAAVESVAENTVDAIVAPIMWTCVFGSQGALGYRAVNTLDAMVGYRNARYERFGRASARMDDAAGWAPARITAALVMLVRPKTAWAVLRCVSRDAPGHPSPNGGVAEAAFAAALGVQLGGLNRYQGKVEQRCVLGEGPKCELEDIVRSVELAQDVTRAATVLAGLAGIVWIAGASVARTASPKDALSRRNVLENG